MIMSDGKYKSNSMTTPSTLQSLDNQYDWQTYITRENTMLWRYIEALGYRSENVEAEVGYAAPIQCKLTSKHLKCDPGSIGDMMGLITERATDDVSYFEKVAEDCYDACERFLEYCEEVAQDDPTALSNTELANRFNEYVDRNTDIVAYREVVFFLDQILDELLDEELERLSDTGEDSTLHLDMIAPNEDLPFIKERKSLLEIAADIEADPDARAAFESTRGVDAFEELPEPYQADIETHIDEYGWVTTARYTGDPLSKSDVIQNIRDILGNAEDSLEQLGNDRAKKESELAEIKAKSERISDLINIAQEYAYLRTYRMDAIFEGDFRLRPFFTEIASRGGVTYEDFIQLTVPEIEKGLTGGINAESLRERAEIRREDDFVVYLINDELTVGQGGDARKVLETDVDEQDEGDDFVTADARTEKRISGRVAQRGKVTAPAKIVRSENDIDKVNEDDILVSPMTTPDMTVGIAKAGGIITDEGGVASHAAIISREFGIPCLIGTEVATSILHDEDKVVLEATDEEGTARLIQDEA
jgi:phosphoenolpyruvate synthase/pyruvate phosphate dikinase